MKRVGYQASKKKMMTMIEICNRLFDIVLIKVFHKIVNLNIFVFITLYQISSKSSSKSLIGG